MNWLQTPYAFYQLHPPEHPDNYIFERVMNLLLSHMHSIHSHALENKDNCIFARVMNLLQIDSFHSVNRLSLPTLKVHSSINLIPSSVAPEKEKQIKSLKHWSIVIMKNNGNSMSEWNWTDVDCLNVVKAGKKPSAKVVKA